MNALEIEEQDIELQLLEISLKRRKLEIEREKLVENKPKAYSPELHFEVKEKKESLCLHYSNSAKESLMRISNITQDGCILLKGANNSEVMSKKYNIRSLKWIQNMLSNWAKKQKMESHFWENVALKYSKKFLEGDSISRTTIEKLCYLVDSGMMDFWFNKYDNLKGMGQQSTLDGS